MRRHTRSRVRKRTRFLLSSIPLLLFVVLGAVGPMIGAYHPEDVSVHDRLVPPLGRMADGSVAWFGTDSLGRPLLPQVIEGARLSLTVAISTVCLASLVGLVAGLVAGYFGGVADMIIMRLVDVQLAFPALVIAMSIAAVLRPSIITVIAAISISMWASFSRVVRANVLRIREEVFVEAARATGCPNLRILRAHVTPFVISPLLVVASTALGVAIMSEASLSFLGLGVPRPAASWGSIVSGGRSYLVNGWWISTIPGIVMMACVFSAAIFGDSLRDLLDPTSK